MHNELIFYAITCRAAIEISTGSTKFPRLLQNLQVGFDGSGPENIVDNVDDFRSKFCESLDWTMMNPSDPYVDATIFTAIGIFIRAEVSPDWANLQSRVLRDSSSPQAVPTTSPGNSNV